MDKIKSMCERRRMIAPEQDRLWTYQFMVDTLDLYSKVFNSLDTISRLFRIIDHNRDDLESTQAAVRITQA